MDKIVLVIGHPLIAEENRNPFQSKNGIQYCLVSPHVWSAKSAGHRYVFQKNENGKRKIESLNTIFNGFNTFYFWIGLNQLLEKISPDIIYCWSEAWCFSTWQVAYLTRNKKIPLLFYSAENRPKNLPFPFSFLQKKCFNNYSGCVVPTEEIEARIQTAGFTKKVFIVPLPISIAKLIQANAANKKLIYVGRLIFLKQVHFIIESLLSLDAFTLEIIGDGPERNNLEHLVKKLKLGRRVFFRGFIPNQKLNENLDQASLLILPTAENPKQAEQFGKAALEGLAYGLPVLTNNTGNLVQLSKRFDTLTAKPLNNAPQMVNAIESIMSNYPSQDSINQTREKVLSYCGSSQVTEIFHSVFHAMLNKIEPQTVLS